MSSTSTSSTLVAPHRTAGTPFPYIRGQTIDLKTFEGQITQVAITRVCSMTVSPVMEVQLNTQHGSRTAILKLFDRRYGEVRKKHPHNQQSETTWQHCIRSGLANRLLEDLQRDEENIKKARFEGDDNDGKGEEEEEDDDEEGEEQHEDSSDEAEDGEDEEDDIKEWEAIIYHTTQRHYTNEVRAYSELKLLQGRCIPTFLGSVVYTPPEAPADLPSVYFEVPGILLECIRGFPLSELTSQIPNQPRLWENIVEGAIEVAREVNHAGVVHHDCQPRNVVVAEAGNGAFQSYLIDFSQCAFRADYKNTDDVDDEDGFAYIVHLVDNHGAIAVIMKQKVKRETSYTLQLKTLSG